MGGGEREHHSQSAVTGTDCDDHVTEVARESPCGRQRAWGNPVLQLVVSSWVMM
jgi:hypothetical protein